MTGPHLVIRFQRPDANDDRLDIPRLAHTLIRIDRPVTPGLVAMETGRFPRDREPRPPAMQVYETTNDSLDLFAICYCNRAG